MWLMGLLIQVGEEGGGGAEGAEGAGRQRVSVETIARVGETAAMLGGRVYDDDDVQKAVIELITLCRKLTAARALEANSMGLEEGGRRGEAGDATGEAGKGGGGVAAPVGLALTGCLYAGPGLAPVGIDGLGLEERLVIGAVAGRLAS